MAKMMILQVMDEIGLRLAEMTTANGYTHEAGKVERARVALFKNIDLPAINYWSAFDSLKERKYQKESRTVDVRIEAYQKTYDHPFTDIAMELANDVWTVLNRATAHPAVSDDWSPNLGGLLTIFELRQITPMIGEGELPWCGAVLNLEATYRVDSFDFTQLT